MVLPPMIAYSTAQVHFLHDTVVIFFAQLQDVLVQVIVRASHQVDQLVAKGLAAFDPASALSHVLLVGDFLNVCVVITQCANTREVEAGILDVEVVIVQGFKLGAIRRHSLDVVGIALLPLHVVESHLAFVNRRSAIERAVILVHDVGVSARPVDLQWRFWIARLAKPCHEELEVTVSQFHYWDRTAHLDCPHDVLQRALLTVHPDVEEFEFSQRKFPNVHFLEAVRSKACGQVTYVHEACVDFGNLDHRKKLLGLTVMVISWLCPQTSHGLLIVRRMPCW
ncbi:hypothetical protein D3C71_858170 [compost metagenome]